MKRLFLSLLLLLPLFAMQAKSPAKILKASDFEHYVSYFNRMEDEPIVQAIPNAEAWAWMEENIPLFACPQDNFEEMWYFRWWSLRKGLHR